MFHSNPEWERGGGGGGVLSYITYMGICCCERYGFQAVKSGIGHRYIREF